MRKTSGSQILNGRIFLLALVVGLIITSVEFAIDQMIHHLDRLYASDLYTLIVAVGMSYLVMMYEQRRRTILARRMEIAAEVNHHIRNALTAVVFSASVQNDPMLQSVIQDATARIDWVLTTVLPDGAEEQKWPVQVPEWKPGTWKNPNDPQPDSKT